MMDEAAKISAEVKPQEIFFTADAMTGQDVVNSAAAFAAKLPVTGVALTKLDGDSRGGAALSVMSVTGKPIRFAGTGERPDALEPFDAARMASRILGMGDVVGLVEKAQEAFDADKARQLERKLAKSEFTLEDFREQLGALKKMGSFEQILGMIPGMGNALKGATVDEKALSRIEAIIGSMTARERRKPVIIDGSRRKRIAAGSGTTVTDVNRLLKQFDDMKKMMKRMTGMMGKGRSMRQMAGSLGFGR
jgi:signal recognition particle subunit SRP54